MTPDVIVTVSGQSPALPLVLQLFAALVGAMAGAGAGAYLGYRFAVRIEDRRQAVANLQHHATHLSEALRAFAALGAELGANSTAVAARLEALSPTLAKRRPRPLGSRTAVWDGRAADVAHFVHELTPDEYEATQASYDALAAFEVELERAFQLEIEAHSSRGIEADISLKRSVDEARALGQTAAVEMVAPVAAIAAVRRRLTAQARQMGEAAQDLYAGTPFAAAPDDTTAPGSFGSDQS
jgi:hypothetical protein